MSSDGGASFAFVEAVDAPLAFTDRGSMATGPGGVFAVGSLWVIFEDRGAQTITVAGAALDAAGSPVLDSCGPGTGFFCNRQVIAVPSGDILFPGHVAVGPSGQVLATFFRKLGIPSGAMDVFVAIDPDGLGPEPFVEPPGVNPVLLTNIGFVEKIAPHMPRGITPLANLAWDLTTGRVYLVSTREMPNDSDETDIVLLHSDDEGATWSAPRNVNKDISPPGEVRSQFFPHVAVDQTTGLVAVAWHDPRNDDGGVDGIPNTETEVYAAISADGGNYFHELPVSSGFSRASDLPSEIETSHGDYLGVAFHDDNIHVAWVDNSNSAGDNPDAGSPPGCDPVLCMDAYTGRIPLPEPGSAMSSLAGVVVLWGLAMRRRACARLQSRPTGVR
jgi:hypothetical protein